MVNNYKSHPPKGSVYDLYTNWYITDSKEEKENMDPFDNEPVGPDSFGGTDEESHYISKSAESLKSYWSDTFKKSAEENLSNKVGTPIYSVDQGDRSKPIDYIKQANNKVDHGWIQLYSGKKFFPLNPRPEDIDIYDIAHSLSRICRFSGHVKCEHYSVAQHSVLVSHLCDASDALYGLLHDASEAYIGDINSVLKKMPMFTEYKQVEHRLQSMIYQKFGLNPTEPTSVKNADMKMLATEARDLMSPLNEDWVQPCEPYPFKIEPLSANETKSLFLNRFFELKNIRVINGDVSGEYLQCNVDTAKWNK